MRYVLRGDAKGGDQIQALVDAHFRIALSQMSEGEWPELFTFAKYELDRPGRPEDWFTPSALVANGGKSDCNDFAVYHAAWLRTQRGVQAVPETLRVGPGWHVVVRMPDGSLIDPSARLGMPLPTVENENGEPMPRNKRRRRGTVAGIRRDSEGTTVKIYGPGGAAVEGYAENVAGVGAFGDRIKAWWRRLTEDRALSDVSSTAKNAAKAFGRMTPAGQGYLAIADRADSERGELLQNVKRAMQQHSNRSRDYGEPWDAESVDWGRGW